MFWLMTQTWHDLLFIHWPVPAHELRPLVPRQLELDHQEGTTWVSAVAFHLTNNRLRWLPPIPGTTAYPALNLRTYVNAGGKRGVYFFSIDADHRAMVWGGRMAFKLPYYKASIQLMQKQDSRQTQSPKQLFKCERQDANSGFAAFQVCYRPLSSDFPAAADPLTEFLTERYYLFTVDQKDRLLRGQILHKPWMLHQVELDMTMNTVAGASLIDLPSDYSLAYYASSMKVYLSGLKHVKSDLSESY